MVETATDISIRAAVAEDAAPIARVHVESWRSTYAGILPDEILLNVSLIHISEPTRQEAISYAVF